jgi:type II secretory pathway pseudopilin PulG
MRATTVMRAAAVMAVLVAPPREAAAQAANQAQQQIQQQIDQLRREFNDRLTALEAQLAALQGGQPAPPPPAAPPTPAPPTTVEVPPGAAGAGGPTGALPIYGVASLGSKIFNPDIAVIGDFLGDAGRNTVDPSPALEMHESEAAFQAIVDPYARADFFFSFGEEGVGLEEGYLTLTSLPGGFLTKVGKMRANFGKVNTLHNHVLPWTDRPMVNRYLVGGEDGIDDAGFSVARLIPAGALFLEATGEVFRGDSDELFRSRKPGNLSYVGHLRGYHDITESTNLDLGTSYAYGHTADLRPVESGLGSPTVPEDVDLSRFITQLFGIDATLRWKPLSRAIYHSFVGRGEIVWSRREQFGGRQDATGYYVSGDYQFARRWFVGGRYDRSGHADDATVIDKGASALLTYWPSEFSQVRGQYRRTNYFDAPAANELLFQFQFSIGAHGAHPF